MEIKNIINIIVIIICIIIHFSIIEEKNRLQPNSPAARKYWEAFNLCILIITVAIFVMDIVEIYNTEKINNSDIITHYKIEPQIKEVYYKFDNKNYYYKDTIFIYQLKKGN